jgi:hypothetical protein
MPFSIGDTATAAKRYTSLMPVMNLTPGKGYRVVRTKTLPDWMDCEITVVNDAGMEESYRIILFD